MINTIKRLHYAHMSSQMPVRIRLRTAYHEAAHAYFMTRSPLWKNVRISLNSGGGLASSSYNKREAFSDGEAAWLIARMSIAGAVAENYFFGSYSKFGAAQDMGSAYSLISGREPHVAEYVNDNFIETSFEMLQAVALHDASIRTQSILGGAALSAGREIAKDAQKIRKLGKELYKKSFLCDKEIRKILD